MHKMYDNITHKLLHEKSEKEWEDVVKSIKEVSKEYWKDCCIPSESDPSGLDQHSPGAKVDAGKIRMSLVLDGFKRALTEVGRVGTFGANKYSDNGWMEVENGIARYRDAMYRHLFATDHYDDQSGLSHMAHAAWNMLAMLELMEREESSPLTKVKENGD